MPDTADSIIMRRPMIGIACAYISGVFLHAVFPAPQALLVAAPAVLLALCLVMNRIFREKTCILSPDITPKTGLSRLCVFPLITLAAWLAADFAGNAGDAGPCRIMRRPTEAVEITGVIADDPQRSAYAAPGQVAWNFTLELESIRRVEHPENVSAAVDVRLGACENERAPRYGDRVSMSGRLEDRLRLAGEDMPARFKAETSGRRYVFRGDAADMSLISEENGRALIAWCFALRRRFAAMLERGIEDYPVSSAVFQAMSLGLRGRVPYQSRDVFMRTGVAHIFAISGQHVLIVSLFAIFLLQISGVSRPWWFLALAPALVLYTIISGGAASAVRGCIMATSFAAAPMTRRRFDALSALGLAAVLILAINPGELFAKGFILSFAAVLGLCLIYPKIYRLAAKPAHPDPARLQPESKLKNALRQSYRAAWAVIAATLAAWIMTGPLCALWFNLVSPIGVVANLAAAPALLLTMVSGCCSVLFGAFVPALGELYNFAALGLISVFLHALELMSRVPGGHWFVPPPCAWSVSLWYAGAAVFAAARSRTSGLIAALMFASALGIEVAAAILPETSVEVLNIDGDGAVIATTRDGTWLIDPGPPSTEWTLTRRLRRGGVNRLAAIVVTHPLRSRAGATENLLKTMRVKELWLPAVGPDTPTRKRLIAAAQSAGTKIRLLQAGETIAPGGGLTWEVLHPVPGAKCRSAADAALVLRLRGQFGAILLRGEASPSVERNLLDSNKPISAAILVLTDMQARKGCGADFIRTVAPESIAICGPLELADDSPAPLRIPLSHVARIELDSNGRLKRLAPPVRY